MAALPDAPAMSPDRGPRHGRPGRRRGRRTPRVAEDERQRAVARGVRGSPRRPAELSSARRVARAPHGLVEVDEDGDARSRAVLAVRVFNVTLATRGAVSRTMPPVPCSGPGSGSPRSAALPARSLMPPTGERTDSLAQRRPGEVSPTRTVYSNGRLALPDPRACSAAPPVPPPPRLHPRRSAGLQSASGGCAGQTHRRSSRRLYSPFEAVFLLS